MDKEKSYQIDPKRIEEAFRRVKANRGAAGVDQVSIEGYEERLEDNLYKLWNRMSSGSYFPPSVRGVEIPKKDGRKRLLGIPTVEDRVAQMVVKMEIEPILEEIFHEDSYGYRPNRSAREAILVTRERCWEKAWVLEFDIKGLFDNIDHELLMKAVNHHTENKWVKLYIGRWLKAPFILPDGELQERTKGTPQGGVISPILANLFMHYAFDKWMERSHPENKWARYADDAVIHCGSLEEAEKLLESLKARLKECKLEIHPGKTRIVYCKQIGREEEHEETSFDFLGFTFCSRIAKSRKGEYFLGFLPAASKKSCQSFRDKIKAIRMTHKGRSIEELAAKLNPIIRGWANYFRISYASIVDKELRKVNWSLAMWAMRKYKRLERSPKRAHKFIALCATQRPHLFAHWQMGLLPAM